MNDVAMAAAAPQPQGTRDVLPTGKSPRERQETMVAPAPMVDRYPVVIGQNLTLAYLSSVYRTCSAGLRYSFVDALNELIEHDPHARGVIRQRVLTLAGARIEVTPAKLAPEDPDTELATEIADEVRRQFDNIPGLAQAIGALAWGIVYGLSAAEITWDRTDTGWEVRKLTFIHSRRLSYTDPNSWDLYVWDGGQSALNIYDSTFTRMAGTYGLRMADFPGKFIVHSPQLSGDYPTRDGEGRFLGFYLAIKRMVVRACAQDFERTIRPWVVGYFSRDEQKNETTPAGSADIATLTSAVKALGLGTLNGVVLPDSCKIELLRAASTMDAQRFIEWIDLQVSKAALGQTYTTQPGVNGARAASEVAERGTLRIAEYDARCIADTLERDLLYWMVKFNFPGAERRLCPKLTVKVSEDPTAAEVLALAERATAIDVPVEVDELAERIGLTIVAQDDEESRRTRMVAAGSGPTPPDPNEPPPNAVPNAVKDTTTNVRAEEPLEPLDQAAQ